MSSKHPWNKVVHQLVSCTRLFALDLRDPGGRLPWESSGRYIRWRESTCRGALFHHVAAPWARSLTILQDIGTSVRSVSPRCDLNTKSRSQGGETQSTENWWQDYRLEVDHNYFDDGGDYPASPKREMQETGNLFVLLPTSLSNP